ncbi:hypothetical protein [Alsobacter sp. R-9]
MERATTFMGRLGKTMMIAWWIAAPIMVMLAWWLLIYIGQDEAVYLSVAFLILVLAGHVAFGLLFLLWTLGGFIKGKWIGGNSREPNPPPR